MQALNLPKTDLKIVVRDGKPRVFDVLRRRYVALTPEEWVRQHFVQYLIQGKGYPAECIGNEVSISLGALRKRCDTVVYGCHAEPRMIVEYKSPDVAITQQVFDQISRYNICLHVDWLVVSNGLQHYCCHVDYAEGSYRFVEDIPPYEAIRDAGHQDAAATHAPHPAAPSAAAQEDESDEAGACSPR